MIKKIQQYFAKLSILRQYRKLEAEFAKMKEDALAFEEKCRLELEELEVKGAALQEGPEKTRMAQLLHAVRNTYETNMAERKMRFAQTRMTLDILRISI